MLSEPSQWVMYEMYLRRVIARSVGACISFLGPSPSLSLIRQEYLSGYGHVYGRLFSLFLSHYITSSRVSYLCMIVLFVIHCTSVWVRWLKVHVTYDLMLGGISSAPIVVKFVSWYRTSMDVEIDEPLSTWSMRSRWGFFDLAVLWAVCDVLRVV